MEIRYNLCGCTYSGKRLLAVVCMLVIPLAVVPAAHADYLYEFTYARSSGPIQDFSFSFTSPNLITSATALGFPGATVTDDLGHSWTIEKGQTTSAAPCFEFGTATNTTFYSTWCEAGSGGSGAAFIVSFKSGGFDALPSAPGSYTAASFAGGFGYGGGVDSISGSAFGSTGTFALVISETSAAVPEPATLALLGTGLIGMAGALKRKRHE